MARTRPSTRDASVPTPTTLARATRRRPSRSPKARRSSPGMGASRKEAMHSGAPARAGVRIVVARGRTALGALAQRAEVAKTVNSAGVPVEPLEGKCIASDGFDCVEFLLRVLGLDEANFAAVALATR